MKTNELLRGFNEEELFKQFTLKKIDLLKYLKLCKENNIKYLDVKYLYKKMNNNIKYIGSYLYLYEEYGYELPTFEWITKQYLKNKFNIFDYIDVSKKYYNKLPDNIFKTELFNNNISIFTYMSVCEKYGYEKLSENEFKKQIVIENINIENELQLRKKYHYVLPTHNDLYDIYSNDKIDFHMYLRLCAIYEIDLIIDEQIKTKLYETSFDNILGFSATFNFLDGVKYAIQNGADLKILNDIEISSDVKNYIEIL